MSYWGRTNVIQNAQNIMAITKCIVCESKELSRVMVIKDHLVSGEEFNLEECTNCRFRFISNPPSEIEAGPYYDTEEYVEHSDSNEGVVNWIYHHARKYMLREKYQLLNKLERPKKVLDFGTGTGYFLRHMKSQGYETAGLEISEKARNFGRSKFGLDIYDPTDVNKEDFDSGYGYVTFWHVLEHVYNPIKVLSRLKELMSDDGVIVAALPNYKCLEEKAYKGYWNGYDVPRHLWHFNKDAFSQFAEKAGFEVFKTSMLPLDPFYNCLISESYRKKKIGYALMPFVGMTSLLSGYFNNDKASSIVYYLKKK